VLTALSAETPCLLLPVSFVATRDDFSPLYSKFMWPELKAPVFE